MLLHLIVLYTCLCPLPKMVFFVSDKTNNKNKQSSTFTFSSQFPLKKFCFFSLHRPTLGVMSDQGTQGRLNWYVICKFPSFLLYSWTQTTLCCLCQLIWLDICFRCDRLSLLETLHCHANFLSSALKSPCTGICFQALFTTCPACSYTILNAQGLRTLSSLSSWAYVPPDNSVFVWSAFFSSRLSYRNN